jgi:hypothetical protein
MSRQTKRVGDQVDIIYLYLPILTPTPIGHVFNATYWANIEAYTSVICACLPRVYSLFSKMYHQRFPSDAEHGRICPPQLAHLAATPRASVGRRSSIARAVGRERKSNI